MRSNLIQWQFRIWGKKRVNLWVLRRRSLYPTELSEQILNFIYYNGFYSICQSATMAFATIICRSTIDIKQRGKKKQKDEVSSFMSKSITLDMAYRQSLMKYVEKYGVSRASRKYSKSRSYIYFWQVRWDRSVGSLACQSRRLHSHPNQHTEAELKLIGNMWCRISPWNMSGSPTILNLPIVFPKLYSKTVKEWS